MIKLLLLISLAHAYNQYTPVDQVGICGSPVYRREKCPGECVLVPNGYKCHGAKVVQLMVAGSPKTVSGKLHREVCSSRADCKARLNARATRCGGDPDAYIILKDDEVYCEKVLEWNMVPGPKKVIYTQ